MLGSKDTDGTFEKSRYDRHDIFNFRFRTSWTSLA